MLISILTKINTLNELIFSPFDKLINKFVYVDWVQDAILDSFHLLPLLFVIFILIEIIEFKYTEKIQNIVQKFDKYCILCASLAAILPQCGFSVIIASLYTKKYISLGCLISVFLITSDEAIPLLLAMPEKAYLIIPVIGIKIFVGILSGYFIDCCVARKKLSKTAQEDIMEIHEEGCCKQKIETKNVKELILHPIMHTLNIFSFILVITLFINFTLEYISIENIINGNNILKTITAAFIGLIPNCAISIGITLMLTKGLVTIGTAMACLLSNAGLGLLVLLKNNDFKDTLKIIGILLYISILVGLTIDFIL